MRIDLISQEDFDTLTKIQKKYPILTYQNKGYDGFDKSKMTAEDRIAFWQITVILKNSILGFKGFQNFKLDPKGKVKIRLRYNYNHDLTGLSFIGVGYISLDELLNGFNEKEI